MNIWVIGRNYPTQKNKMQGSFELSQAKMMGKDNHVCYLTLMFHPFKKGNKWGYTTWSEDGINVCAYFQFYAPERMKFRWKAFHEKKWEQLLHTVEEQFGVPDVIHVHYPSLITEPDVILKYREKGAKVIVTEHWTHVLTNSLDSYEKNRLCNYVDYADAVICVGQPLKDVVKDITGTSREIHVVPNVVSSLFQPNESSKEDGSYQFVAVGRLIPHKQFNGIIQAFANKFANQKDYKLLIIGDGPEKTNLKKLAKNAKVEDQVKFTGTLSNKNVAKTVAASDCLICFSKLETFGVPVIEAWASGIPVIASDSLGFLEYFQPFLGYIVSSDSVESLSDAMEKISNNRSQYSKEMIANYAKEHFGKGAIYQQLMQIYKQA